MGLGIILKSGLRTFPRLNFFAGLFHNLNLQISKNISSIYLVIKFVFFFFFSELHGLDIFQQILPH